MAKNDNETKLEAELAATKAKLKDAEDALAASAKSPSAGASVEAHKLDTKGVRKYLVLGARAYVDGQLFRAGDVVTLQDGQAPSRTWRKLEVGETVAQAAATSSLVDPLPPSKPTL